MSGWRLSAGELDSLLCLGKVEWKRLVDAPFFLSELILPLNAAILLFIP